MGVGWLGDPVTSTLAQPSPRVRNVSCLANPGKLAKSHHPPLPMAIGTEEKWGGGVMRRWNGRKLSGLNILESEECLMVGKSWQTCKEPHKQWEKREGWTGAGGVGENYQVLVFGTRST